jgi:uncharacterized protein YqfA (UPF0365 family)
MSITASEFKSNLSRYADLAGKEDIVIARTGNQIVEPTTAAKDKLDILRSLTGIVPSNVSKEEAREERLRKHENRD